jgi:hypothetical protein
MCSSYSALWFQSCYWILMLQHGSLNVTNFHFEKWERKDAVFWDVAPFRSCVNRRFGGTYRFHLQGRKIRERGTSVSRWLQSADGGDTFFRNVGSHKIYTAPHPRRRYSSYSPPWKPQILRKIGSLHTAPSLIAYVTIGTKYFSKQFNLGHWSSQQLISACN